MSAFERVNIKHNPEKIDKVSVSNDSFENIIDDETFIIAEKLMEHLKIIDEYNERIKAIQYLMDSAEKLAGNPIFTTDNPRLIDAIAALGGSGNTVDFELFKKATDIMIQGFEQMALVSFTGADGGY